MTTTMTVTDTPAPVSRKRLWIGSATDCAIALDDPDLRVCYGCPDITLTPRSRGTFWVDGPAAQIDCLVVTVRDRFDGNGGEGFEDGLPALRSMSAFLKRADERLGA